MRNRAEKRHNDWKKAIRKKKIINAYGWDYYDNLHQYSKNKIHCSCPMCSAKTKNKGKKRLKHGNYSPSINYKISEKRKIDSMRDKIKNYEGEFLI